MKIPELFSKSEPKKALLGSFALLLSLGVLKQFLPQDLFFLTALTLIAIHFFPKFRLELFLVANIASWLSSRIVLENLPKIPIFSGMSQVSFVCVIVISNAIMFGLGTLLTANSSHKKLQITAIFFLYLGLLAFSMADLPALSTPVQLAQWCVLFLRGFFLYWLFVVLASPKSPRERAVLLCSSAPFWSTASAVTFVPVVPWTGDYKEIWSTNREQLTRAQLAGLRLLSFSMVALLAHLFIRVSVFGESPVEGAIASTLRKFFELKIGSLDSGFDAALAMHQGPGLKWVAIVCEFTMTYLWIAYNLGFTVSIARLAGFHLPATFNAPWRADSLLNFYGRMLYYYNRLVMQIFYPVCKEAFRGVKSKKLRIVLGIWMAISVGGFFFHFGQDHFWLIDRSLTDTLKVYWRSAYYFLALGALIGLSLLNRRKAATPNRFLPFFSILYLIVWSLVFTLAIATRHTNSSWSAYLTYMLGLFR